MELKDYIVEEADKLFCQFGIRSVTMDDIAKHLGMSKKTIYLHYADKNEMVETVIRAKISGQILEMEKNRTTAENAVQEIFSAITEMHKMFANMNPMLFFDLQKYHPTAWMIVRKFKEEALYKTIFDNIERGKSEGYYRAEIKAEVLTMMRLNQVDMILSTNGNSGHHIIELMTEITEHFLYGLCNINGHNLIKTYQNQTGE